MVTQVTFRIGKEQQECLSASQCCVIELPSEESVPHGYPVKVVNTEGEPTDMVVVGKQRQNDRTLYILADARQVEVRS